MFEKLWHDREIVLSRPSMIHISYDNTKQCFLVAPSSKMNGCNNSSIVQTIERVVIISTCTEPAMDGGCLLKLFKFLLFQSGDFMRLPVRKKEGLTWDEDFPLTSALATILLTHNTKWCITQMYDAVEGKPIRIWMQKNFAKENQLLAFEVVKNAMGSTKDAKKDKFANYVVTLMQQFVQINLLKF